MVRTTSARPSGGRPDGAGEDDVLHLAAAQALGALLAHDPGEGVDDVGLARAVGPDDAGDARLEAQRRRGREGLEAPQGEALEVHAEISRRVGVDGSAGTVTRRGKCAHPTAALGRDRRGADAAVTGGAGRSGAQASAGSAGELAHGDVDAARGRRRRRARDRLVRRRPRPRARGPGAQPGDLGDSRRRTRRGGRRAPWPCGSPLTRARVAPDGARDRALGSSRAAESVRRSWRPTRTRGPVRLRVTAAPGGVNPLPRGGATLSTRAAGQRPAHSAAQRSRKPVGPAGLATTARPDRPRTCPGAPPAEQRPGGPRTPARPLGDDLDPAVVEVGAHPARPELERAGAGPPAEADALDAAAHPGRQPDGPSAGRSPPGRSPRRPLAAGAAVATSGS